LKLHMHRIVVGPMLFVLKCKFIRPRFKVNLVSITRPFAADSSRIHVEWNFPKWHKWALCLLLKQRLIFSEDSYHEERFLHSPSFLRWERQDIAKFSKQNDFSGLVSRTDQWEPSSSLPLTLCFPNIPVFRRTEHSACHLLARWFAEPISSTLKMEAISSSETSGATQRTTRRQMILFSLSKSFFCICHFFLRRAVWEKQGVMDVRIYIYIYIYMDALITYALYVLCVMCRPTVLTPYVFEVEPPVPFTSVDPRQVIKSGRTKY
jgi:hypothetical protein